MTTRTLNILPRQNLGNKFYVRMKMILQKTFGIFMSFIQFEVDFIKAVENFCTSTNNWDQLFSPKNWAETFDGRGFFHQEPGMVIFITKKLLNILQKANLFFGVELLRLHQYL